MPAGDLAPADPTLAGFWTLHCYRWRIFAVVAVSEFALCATLAGFTPGADMPVVNPLPLQPSGRPVDLGR
jgi:hypothetical protein